jgi:hypothetical protein
METGVVGVFRCMKIPMVQYNSWTVITKPAFMNSKAKNGRITITIADIKMDFSWYVFPYFPIQKFEKILPNRSSDVISPVISPKW